MQAHISTNNCSPSKTICYEAYFSSSHCHGSQPFFLDPSVTAFVETEEHTYAVAQPVRLVKPEPKEGVRGKRLTSERIALDDDGVDALLTKIRFQIRNVYPQISTFLTQPDDFFCRNGQDGRAYRAHPMASAR